MKYTFHTYSLPEEKTITVTLKGLPNIPNLSIKEELANLGIIINTCTLISKENSLYATYKINLNAKTTLTHLRKIRYLFHSRIYWEKYINSKKALQCYRCQAFGHTSANCYKNPRCVKCAQSHLTSECKKSPETLAKCCNCSGEHLASFSQCPAYTRYLAKRNQIVSSNDINQTPINNKNLLAQSKNLNVKRQCESQIFSPDSVINPPVNAKRNNNRYTEGQINPLLKSYSAALNNTNMTTNDDLMDLNGLIHEIQKLKQMIDIPRMILIIRNLNIKLATCNDGLDKLHAFIEAAEQLDRNGYPRKKVLLVSLLVL